MHTRLNLHVMQGSLLDMTVDCLIVNLFEGVQTPGGATGAVDKKLAGAISQLIADQDLTGKYKETYVLPTFGKIPAKRVLIVGLGKAGEFNLEKARVVSGVAAKAARQAGAKKVASIVHGAGIGGLDPEKATQALVEGTILSLYRFEKWKKKKAEKVVDEFVVVEFDAKKIPALEKGLRIGRTIAEAVNYTRDLTNTPSNRLTPTMLADQARDVATQHGLECRILERRELEGMGMEAFMGVAKGSEEPPKLIVLKYLGNPAAKELLGLVGKGITFDSGGISIKPGEGMEEMKTDMAGAATVLATIQAVAALKLPINLLVVIPACENMPSGTAQKPGDVVKAYNGKTIEIINTDAEGRLILADAIAYAAELGPTRLVDVATLTGAVIVALGNTTTGLIANDESWAKQVKAAAEEASERLWELPAFEEYKELYKSDVADIKNIGGRAAGTITGGLIIGEFVGKTPWVHLDIAGTSVTKKPESLGPKGATGVMVRTLIQLCRTF